MSTLPNLAAEMARYSISEEEIAKAALCTVEEVEDWLRGEGEPTFYQAKCISRKLFPYMDVEFLFQEDGIGL